jgi:hypothetical protein
MIIDVTSPGRTAIVHSFVDALAPPSRLLLRGFSGGDAFSARFTNHAALDFTPAQPNK